MGRFSYDNSLSVDFDDRVLAHLQVVIGAKLRRGESFHFTWIDDESSGDGRTTVWMHPHANLVYKYFGKRAAVLNRAWIDALMFTANSVSGLHLMAEPPDRETRDRADDLG
ncbi:hypothetical protein GCM10027515_34100 [Schumannella luteola]|uniref:DUF7882 domain-containing protein n=1 Tax=Schumannella luteola TaxID=472059 RepID=A0A852YSU7_9MICO|nr:ATP-dependent DNA ligase [Schumannella luteola]NYH00770.1 hypothetical protein [Schumannella luteola]TPW91719.1 ATP-dependent DNA ligase [Schumannella luteola]